MKKTYEKNLHVVTEIWYLNKKLPNGSININNHHTNPNNTIKITPHNAFPLKKNFPIGKSKTISSFHLTKKKNHKSLTQKSDLSQRSKFDSSHQPKFF